ncbi:uncharacterized protein LOC141648948 [Silene latifolia]|uniref:uncharacterized protein LOC141648948 n=1 Tax=Silene latifolia TaxID=37657 RepID=UPI003D77CAD0
MACVMTCSNIIILFCEKYNGRSCYLVLFYGAPKAQFRLTVLQELEAWLRDLHHPFLILGDFIQVEYVYEKLSRNQSLIGGTYEFNSWRIDNELVDIPFKGPRFTWCNNRKGDKRVYERLDRALGSKDWFFMFPNTGVKHFPIQISDHAPIELDFQLTTNNNNKKPYKIDSWVLEYVECLQLISNSWCFRVTGSPAFQVIRKLARVRQEIRRWAIDKKQEWQKRWEDFDVKLEAAMDLAIREGKDENYTSINDDLRNFAEAAAVFWKQRAKIRWNIDGDTCTKYFFNWIKGRASRNFIYGIKGENDSWIFDNKEMGTMFYKTFMIYITQIVLGIKIVLVGGIRFLRK